MKKIISLILAVLMLMSVLPVSAFAVNFAFIHKGVINYNEVKFDHNFNVGNYTDLKNAIACIKNDDTALINLVNDVTIESELDIDETCTIFFKGGHNFILGSDRGFELNAEFTYLIFDGVGFYHSGNHDATLRGHAIYVDAADCIIYGARFEKTGSRKREVGDNMSSWSGGAVYISSDGIRCCIDKCKFYNCGTQSDGGAVYVGASTCEITGCYFEGCEAFSEGGAVFINEYGCKISGCTFKGCKGSGGAVYVFGEWATIDNCVFNSCSSHAIYVNDNDCRIWTSEFTDCHAPNDGGALFIKDKKCYTYFCIFSNCYVEKKSQSGDYSGGAAYVDDYWGEEITFEKCSFDDCYCPYKGQYVYGGNVTTILNCYPNTKDNALFYKCSFTAPGILGGLFGSTFSNGSVWVVAGIGAVAVVAVAVIIVKKKKKKVTE